MKANRFLSLLPVAMLALVAPAYASQDTTVIPTAGPHTMAEVATDINAALQAIATKNSGSVAPANGAGGVPLAYWNWVDTSGTTKVWKIYDGVQWLTIANIDVSGHTLTVPVGSGGTGQNTLTAHALLVGNGTSGLTQIAVPAAGTMLQGNVAADPTWTPTPTLGVAGTTAGTLSFAGATSGATMIQSQNTASGTLTLPAATDTLIGKATTDILTNKTFDTAGLGNSLAINGLAATDNTGTGKVVRDTSPTLTTPTIGAASATSINKVAITAPATGATLTIPDGVTLTGPAASGTAMTLGNAETVTGAKSFNSGKLIFNGSTSGSTTLNASAAASGTLTLPAATDTLVGRATTDTLTNKTFGGSTNTFAPASNKWTMQDSVDATKQLAFSLSGLTTGTTRTLTVPDASTTLVGTDTTQTLTNKTLTSPAINSPTIGSAGETYNGSTSGATVLKAAATASGTLTLPAATDTLVGKATADTLTNKTFDTAGLGNSLAINGLAATDNTGTGKVVRDTSPTLTTPTIGAASATSINKVAITAPATGATLTIPDGVTLTGPAASGTAMTLGNAETVTGAKSFNSAKLILNGSSSGSTTLNASAAASGTLTLPAATDTLVGEATTDTLTNKTLDTASNTLKVNGNTMTASAGTATVTVPNATDTLVGRATTDTLTNKTFDTAGTGNSFSINGLAATANTGTGSVVRATSPTLVTPVLGAATATSINKMAITAPATGSTLAVADGKIATVSNTLTLTGTDGSSVAFGTGGTVAYQSRNISTGCGLAGGGDLSTDRTLRLNLTVNSQTGTNYTVVDGDCGKVIRLSNASPVAVSLPQANGSTFVSGWSVDFQNVGAGTVTVTPTTSTINGGGSLALTQNQGMHCVSDGANYTCVLGVGAGAGSGTVTQVTCGAGLSGGSITASGTCASYFDPGSITNCTLAASVSSNALTVALKTSLGADPDSTHPCIVSFRNATASTGDYTAVQVTAATSFSTGTSGSTFGSSNGTPFRLWITAINNAGTVALGVSSQSNSTAVLPLNEAALQSTTACNACTNATTLGTIYSTAAQTSKAIRILGYMDWASGLTTAGSYASGPTTIQLMTPGVHRPGEVVQSAYAVNNTSTTATSATAVQTASTASITRTSTANLVKITASGIIQNLSTSVPCNAYISRGTTPTPVGSVVSIISTGGETWSAATPFAFDQPGTTAAVTYYVYINFDSTVTSTCRWNTSASSNREATIYIEEIMGALPMPANDNFNPGVFSMTG